MKSVVRDASSSASEAVGFSPSEVGKNFAGDLGELGELRIGRRIGRGHEISLPEDPGLGALPAR